MAFRNGPNVITKGLVLCLDAGDKNSYPGSGTTWFDLSGKRNHGTLINGPTFSSTNGGGIVFDGVNDYINCGVQSSLNIVNEITLACWVKINSAPSTTGNPNLIDKWDWPNNLRSYFIGTEGGVFATAISRDGTFSNRLVVLDNVSPSLGVYYYICSTYNGLTLTAYRNSSVIGTASYNSTYSIFSSINTETWIGRSRDTGQGGRWIAANMFSVQIYNRALSAAEIAINYNAQKSRFNL